MIKITILFSIFFISLLLSMQPHRVAADSPQFYPNNFARTPIERGDPDLSTNENHETIYEEQKLETHAEQTATPVPSPTPDNLTNNAEAASGGIKILWVEAVISATPAEHLTDSVKELLVTSDRFEIPLGQVTIVGRPDNRDAFKNILGALTLREADLSYEHTVPEELPVDSSPTWIIGTDKGEFVLEAAGPISKFINQEGRFLVPNTE